MGRTDWDRVRAMSEEEIERGAQEDPDNPPWTEAELAAAVRATQDGEIKRNPDACVAIKTGMDESK